MELRFDEIEGHPQRVVVDGVSIITKVTTYVLSPDKCLFSELRQYVLEVSERDSDGSYNIRNHPVLGDFDSYDFGIDSLTYEVASWLNEMGLSVIDEPGYRY